MLRRSLFEVIREEERRLGAQIAEAKRRPGADSRLLARMQREASDLRRELAWFPEAYEGRAGSPH